MNAPASPTTAASETALSIEEGKEVGTKPAALERLRAEREAVEKRRQADGEARGKAWALSADYETLERVASIDLDSIDFAEVQEAFVYALAAALLDEDRPSKRAVVDVIEHTFGYTKIPDGAALGFIFGAATVFDEV